MADTSSYYHNVNDANTSNYPLLKDNADDTQTLLSDKEVHPDQLSDDQGEGHAHKKDAPKASIMGCSLNIANTIMGAGVLALPNIVRQFGILLGSAIIIVSCILTLTSCVLLLKSKNLSKHSKFISIGKHCFGTAGLWAVKWIIIINNFGLCIIYLIVFSTVSQNLVTGFATECLDNGDFYCQHWFLVLIGTAIVSPLIFAKSIAKLSGASAIAVGAAITFSIVTVVNCIRSYINGDNAPNIHVLPVIDDVTTALSSITSVFLAFTFQFNFFPVYKTLKDPTDQRMKKTTASALGMVIIIYLVVANCGYLTFGELTSDLLKQLTRDRIGIASFIIINCVLMTSSTLTQPLMFFTLKNEVYGAIKLLRKKLDSNVKKVKADSPQEQTDRDSDWEKEDENDEKVIERKYGFKGIYYNVYVIVLFAIIVVMAIVVPGINVVFSFVGSTAANGLNAILPALFYMKLCSRHGKLRKVSMFIFVLGVVLGIVGIVSSALSLT